MSVQLRRERVADTISLGGAVSAAGAEDHPVSSKLLGSAPNTIAPGASGNVADQQLQPHRVGDPMSRGSGSRSSWSTGPTSSGRRRPSETARSLSGRGARASRRICVAPADDREQRDDRADPERRPERGQERAGRPVAAASSASGSAWLTRSAPACSALAVACSGLRSEATIEQMQRAVGVLDERLVVGGDDHRRPRLGGHAQSSCQTLREAAVSSDAGRLVGEHQPRAGWPAPVRSQPAGVHRPTGPTGRSSRTVAETDVVEQLLAPLGPLASRHVGGEHRQLDVLPARSAPAAGDAAETRTPPWFAGTPPGAQAPRR